MTGTALGLLLALASAGCDRSSPSATSGSSGGGRGGFEVVAAEDVWGSIAAQLAGARASVRSIIVNPNTDPHSYEPNAGDARTMAASRLAIINGLGYDNWAHRLLQASPSGRRVVLTVGSSLGLSEGENPHQWYSPTHVLAVARRIAADYQALDPADAAFFARREQLFTTADLARYDELRREIRARYRGVPVGYSESIFAPLGEDLGLRLVTPYSFAKAIAEGTDVTAADKEAVDSEAEGRLIKVWVFNSQNVTPDVQRVNEIARARGIPVVSVTETLSPAGTTFQRWQSSQLERLLRALGQATGR